VPVIIVAAAVLGLLLFFVIAIPFSLVMRYRVGKARRLARAWVVTANLVMLSISLALFLVGAAMTNIWVPRAFVYGLAGLAAGGTLGVLGLLATRWERTPNGLFFTPNRWLVLLVTLVVAARISFGIWRSWHAWHHGAGAVGWLEAFGVAQSLAAGAIVLGYYLVYLLGLRRRLRPLVQAGSPSSRVFRRTRS
jgi:hypothetical protein